MPRPLRRFSFATSGVAPLAVCRLVASDGPPLPRLPLVIHEGGAPIRYAADGSGKIDLPSKPREARQFNGIDYIMEEAITGDYALIRVRPTPPARRLPVPRP